MFRSTLSNAAQATLALLGESGLVKDAYLAGGSALALHFGHRYSIDFDFFSQKTFDPQKLGQQLAYIGKFQETVAKGISLIGELNGIKMSYFGYDYPLIAPVSKFLGVNIAHPHDIAAMKLVAILDRGTKRDFIDLFELIKQGVNLEDMFTHYEKKYQKLEQNLFSLIKALQYFDDAEGTNMPRMIRSILWEKVKRFFTAESLRLAKKHLSI